MKSNLFKILSLAGLSLAGLLIFILNFTTIFPIASPKIYYNKKQITYIATKTLINWGYTPGDYEVYSEFRSREGLLHYVQKNFSPDSVKLLLENQIPAYYWATTWTRPKTNGKLLDSQNSFPGWAQRVGLHMDKSGHVFAFWIEVDRDSSITSFDENTAIAFADSIFRVRAGSDTSLFEFSKIRKIDLDKRTDYFIQYSRIKPLANLPVQLQIELAGNRLTRFEYVYEKIENNRFRRSAPNDWILPVLVYLILLLMFASVFIKKLRNDEINIRSAIPVGLIIYFSLLIPFLLNFKNFDFPNVMGMLIISPLLMGFMSVIAVSCADALARDSWNDKLLTFDALTQGKIRYNLFSSSILTGFAMGFILLGLCTVFLRIAGLSTHIDLTNSFSDPAFINTYLPFISSLSNTVSSVIWSQFVFILFLLSFFSRYFSRKRWIVLILAVFWIFGMGFNDQISSPAWVTAGYCFIISVFYVLVFFKYDFLTSITANLVFLLTIEIVRLFFLKNHFYSINAAILVFILLLILIAAFTGINRIISREELLRFSPGHVKKIFERERLKRELEIAKRVQLSFLPRSNPEIQHLDIASICYPAEQVGGDYYDFIKLSDSKLGIAIGDVSGKGISAAFYMTLTKGFLRSLTRTSLSPKNVLSEINSLFYENVERQHFISMIYGVFDLEKMTFTFARAGHNPVIGVNTNIDFVNVYCPAGMALGLDKGGMFDSLIEEKSIPLNTNDIFVFYTDGYSEAMNSQNEEYGEERLSSLISDLKEKNAHSVLISIKDSISKFVGKKPQHDDMTMVVVKIK